MAYRTIAQLKYIIMRDKRITISDVPGSAMDEADAEIFRDAEEGYINMMLAKKYVVPLTAPSESPTVLETTEWNYVCSILEHRWAAAIYSSVYAANVPDRTDYAEEHRTIADALLQKLIDGDVILTQQTLSDTGIEETKGRPVSSVETRELEQKVTLTDTGRDNAGDLTYENLKEYSETITNLTRTTTYVRDTDYSIDYIKGQIWRLSGSGITSGQQVYVTYWYYLAELFPIRRIKKETDEYLE